MWFDFLILIISLLLHPLVERKVGARLLRLRGGKKGLASNSGSGVQLALFMMLALCLSLHTYAQERSRKPVGKIIEVSSGSASTLFRRLKSGGSRVSWRSGTVTPTWCATSSERASSITTNFTARRQTSSTRPCAYRREPISCLPTPSWPTSGSGTRQRLRHCQAARASFHRPADCTTECGSCSGSPVCWPSPTTGDAASAKSRKNYVEGHALVHLSTRRRVGRSLWLNLLQGGAAGRRPQRLGLKGDFGPTS